MLSRNQYFTQLKKKSGQGRLLDPRRAKSPPRYLICIPIVLTWLRCNSLCASEGERCRLRTTWLIYSSRSRTLLSAFFHLICCGDAAAAAGAKKRWRKNKSFPALILRSGGQLWLLCYVVAALFMSVCKILVAKLWLDFCFPNTGCFWLLHCYNLYGNWITVQLGFVEHSLIALICRNDLRLCCSVAE